MRIGHGYDVHAFGEGDKLILGGVAIPYYQSFIAHSPDRRDSRCTGPR